MTTGVLPAAAERRRAWAPAPRVPVAQDAGAAAAARLLRLQQGAGNRATAQLAGSARSAPAGQGMPVRGVARRPVTPAAAARAPGRAKPPLVPASAGPDTAPPGLSAAPAEAGPMSATPVGPRVARGLVGDAVDWVGQEASAAVDAARARVLPAVMSHARSIPGYKLLGVVLGRDPVSGEEVPRTAASVVAAVLALVPGGERIQAYLDESKAVERAADWLQAEWPKLGLTWPAIRALFGQAWDAISVTDLVDPAAAWAKLAHVFGPPLSALAGFARSAAGKAMEFVFEGALALAGTAGDQVMAIIRKAGDVVSTIVHDPARFLNNLIGAVRAGLGQFVGNIGTHLKSGLVSWLTGSLGGLVRLPARWDLKGVVSLVLDLLGLTWATLRGKLVTLLGERAVGMMEGAVDWIQRIVHGGLGAVADKVAEMATGLMDTVIGGIRDWVAKSVVGAAVTKLVTMFNPVGAVIQAIISAYNTVMFFVERAQQIAAFANSVFDSIAKIAAGNIGDAANAVEQALARSIPVLLGFLARLIGLGDVAAPVRGVVGQVREFVDKALDRVAAWLARLGRKAVGWFRGERGKPAGPEQAGAAPAPLSAIPADPAVGTDALDDAQARLATGGHSSVDEVDDVVRAVFQKHSARGLAALRFEVVNEETMEGRLVAAVGPRPQDPAGAPVLRAVSRATTVDQKSAVAAPGQRVVRWNEIFGPLDPSRVAFLSQPRDETSAAVSVNGVRYGEVQVSGGGRHAEHNLLNAYWKPVLAAARSSVAARKDTTVAIVINRAPCHMNCTPRLAAALMAVDPAVKEKVHWVLAPTGLYEPTESLTAEEMAKQQAELTEMALRLGKPAESVLKQWLSRVALTEDTTTISDLGELIAAGWDVSQLDAGRRQTSGGKALAEACHRLAEKSRTRAGT